MKIQPRLKQEEILYTIRTQKIINPKIINKIKMLYNKNLKLPKMYFSIKIINR